MGDTRLSLQAPNSGFVGVHEVLLGAHVPAQLRLAAHYGLHVATQGVVRGLVPLLQRLQLRRRAALVLRQLLVEPVLGASSSGCTTNSLLPATAQCGLHNGASLGGVRPCVSQHSTQLCPW